jgi:hypothetical protein
VKSATFVKDLCAKVRAEDLCINPPPLVSQGDGVTLLPAGHAAGGEIAVRTWPKSRQPCPRTNSAAFSSNRECDRDRCLAVVWHGSARSESQQT